MLSILNENHQRESELEYLLGIKDAEIEDLNRQLEIEREASRDEINKTVN